MTLFVRVFLALLALCLTIESGAQQATALAPYALESSMTFTSTVVLPEGQAATRENVEHMIHEQTKHLLSEFESAEYARFIGAKPNGEIGVMGLGALEDFEIISKEKNDNGTLGVTYRARMKVLVDKKFIEPKEHKSIKFFVPRDPTHIYVKERTDKTYPQKEYFYYYWKPPYKDSDAKFFKGPDQVDLVEAELLGLMPPPETAKPRYDLIEKSIRERGELRIDLLLGFNLKSTDPHDLGRVSYNQFLNYFKKMGFEFDRVVTRRTGPFAVLVRKAQGKTPRVRLSVSLSVSDINSPVTFARRLRDAFEDPDAADLTDYIGHSGLGHNLDLPTITALSSPDPEHPIPIKFSKRYQIMYFNSCASYYFYSEMYALAKQGAHNIDVITNGLTADFSTQNPETQAFFERFLALDHDHTWVDLLKHSEDVKQCTYLLNVLNVPR